MKIYIDEDFKCHVTDNGNMTVIETEFFNGKCQRFIEGFRFVPQGKQWVNLNGVIFFGEMIAPWKDYTLLEAYQAQYEETQKQLQTAYQEGVNSV